MARHDFAARQAVNFRRRLDGHLIGEAVLYRFGLAGRRGSWAAASTGPTPVTALRHRAFHRGGGWALFGLTLAKW